LRSALRPHHFLEPGQQNAAREAAGEGSQNVARFVIVACPKQGAHPQRLALLGESTVREAAAVLGDEDQGAQHLLIGAAACGLLARVSACLLAKAGEIRMRGENIDAPSSAVGAIVQAGLRAGASQRLGRRAFLAVHADGLVNVTRPTVRLDQVPVWTAPRLAATVGADLGVRFP
jgi:hypothetical protein